MPPKEKRKLASEIPAANGDAPKAKVNRTDSALSDMNFSSSAKNKDGKSWNCKISTWNVAGLRAWIKKDGLSFLEHESPDVICLQEIKCAKDKLPSELTALDAAYPHRYFYPAQKEGYSGVAILSKTEPEDVVYGLNNKEHDSEGRCITAEFDDFTLVTTYVPNAGRKLVTLPKRMDWDPIFREHLVRLDTKEKPVIVCGDLNVAHKEIDLANPKTNKRSAGFTAEERAGFDALLAAGFVDTFRKLYPNKEKAYTYWTYMMNCRAKNVGWRLDYFLVSAKSVDKVLCDNVIRDQVFGSDHCPSTLFMRK